ncbi:MAG: potassium-transporting ATPase subunit KdpB [Alphaproteobacteria bacterium]
MRERNFINSFIKLNLDLFKKLSPVKLVRNPIMLIVELIAFYISYYFINEYINGNDYKLSLQLAIWLWITILISVIAESIAEKSAKAKSDFFSKIKTETFAKKLEVPEKSSSFKKIHSSELKMGDYILIEAGELIARDGEIVEGIAMINESAITGESAAVLREAGGDRSAVTAGTEVLTDWIIVKVTVKEGESFLDQMISLIDGSKRQKTPNEISLSIILISLTIVFIIVTFSVAIFASKLGIKIPIIYLLALIVALIPTTISSLMSAIGIAGAAKLLKINVIVKSARAIEAAGDINTLLLDKTGTITIGNRIGYEFYKFLNIDEKDFIEAIYLSSIEDETPEGRSIVKLFKEKYNVNDIIKPQNYNFINFTAETRISGINYGDVEIRKGAADAIINYIGNVRKTKLIEIRTKVESIAKLGGTPLLVTKNKQVLGVIYLKDIIKSEIKERLNILKSLGVKTIMVTGDNFFTASSIALEVGVDDFLAETTPEKKLEFIKKEQEEGRLVAMCGDGSNDAPALAQADVAIAMNTGTQAAREASNIIDLDNDPTKLLDIIKIGKQILIKRGILTTFSLANDIAKYFAILPAIFIKDFPEFNTLNILNLASAESAILSSIIFNSLIIPALIPFALRDFKYNFKSPKKLLLKNLVIYGVSGLVVPFVGIKIIDSIIVTIGLI